MVHVVLLSVLSALPSPSPNGDPPPKAADLSQAEIYTLANDSGMTVKVTNFGAIILSIVVPDRDGTMGDVALGYDTVQEYVDAVDKPYFGAVVGRYGNRIAKGKFTLDGETYTLAVNNDPNHLHGGLVGFDKVIWDVTSQDDHSIALSYKSDDMEEGYPGNLTVRVTYTVTDENALQVDYRATTDKATPVNVTQHTYFNLKGEGDGNILDHKVMLNADRFTPVDDGLIPTGELRPVKGTPFDFTEPKAIGRDIHQDTDQLRIGGGYDHNWVLNGEPGELRLAARVTETTTGRVMEIHTTEPGVQFYTGNFLDGRLTGKSGREYVHRGGFCLETQHFPDSPNQEDFPSTILRPGEEMTSQTVFKFSAE